MITVMSVSSSMEWSAQDDLTIGSTVQLNDRRARSILGQVGSSDGLDGIDVVSLLSRSRH